MNCLASTSRVLPLGQGSNACRRSVSLSSAVVPSRRRYVHTTAFFQFGKPKAPPAPVKVVRETIIPKPAFNVPLGALAISGLAAYEDVTAVAWVFGILGAFLALQATRVRFKFDDEALEVVVGKEQEESENAFVGGRNRWTYDSFVNWEFWWPNFPVLVYFKETQTKPEGQIHFFPIIFDGKQLYDVMVERCGASMNSGPKDE